MADGAAALDAHIARIRQLPGLVKRAAPEVRDVLERELRLTIAAGRSPSGVAWKPRADGSQALQNAASALAVTVVGTVVIARLTGVEVRHHLGAVKGGIRRQILPSGGIPAPVSKGIHVALTREFRRTMGAGA